MGREIKIIKQIEIKELLEGKGTNEMQLTISHKETNIQSKGDQRIEQILQNERADREKRRDERFKVGEDKEKSEMENT